MSASAAATGPRPVIITTDMAGDDLLAVMALLREPSVDVRAIAVDGNGEVHCLPGIRNMLHLLEAFGEADIPIGCGREEPGPSGQLFPEEWRAGADRFYGVEMPPLEGSTADTTPAPQLIAEAAAAAPSPPLIVALGTWTSIADAVAADPTLVDRVAGIHAMGGAIDVPGNIEYGDVTFDDGVEWNLGVDPEAVAAVMATKVPVTLVPLDATNHVPVPPDFATMLETDHEAAGADIAFEMFARSPALTFETSFWDTLAVMALADPTLVTWEEVTVAVSLEGSEAGRLVRSPTGRPVRAAMSADPDTFLPALLEALRRGDARPEPFEAATMTIRWDGATCRVENPPAASGAVMASLVNDADSAVAMGLVGVIPPKTWQDVLAYAAAGGPTDPDAVLPAWIRDLGAFTPVEPHGTAIAITEVPAGVVGGLCATGEWPDLTFTDGGSFTVEP